MPSTFRSNDRRWDYTHVEWVNDVSNDVTASTNRRSASVALAYHTSVIYAGKITGLASTNEPSTNRHTTEFSPPTPTTVHAGLGLDDADHTELYSTGTITGRNPGYGPCPGGEHSELTSATSYRPLAGYTSAPHGHLRTKRLYGPKGRGTVFSARRLPGCRKLCGEQSELALWHVLLTPGSWGHSSSVGRTALPPEH